LITVTELAEKLANNAVQVRVWDTANGGLAAELADVDRFSAGPWVAFSPDGHSVAEACTLSIVVWNLDTGRKQAEFAFGQHVKDWQPFFGLRYSRDGVLTAMDSEGLPVLPRFAGCPGLRPA
jgi:hypothetical protein